MLHLPELLFSIDRPNCFALSALRRLNTSMCLGGVSLIGRSTRRPEVGPCECVCVRCP